MSFGSPKGGASGTLVAIAVSLLVSDFLPETEQQKNDREKLEAVAPEIQKELAGLSGAITELASKASSKTVYATITLLVHRTRPAC